MINLLLKYSHAMPLIEVMLPSITAVLIILFRSKIQNIFALITIISAITGLLISLLICYLVYLGIYPSSHISQMSNTINLNLKVDPLGAIFGLMVFFLWMINTIFSIGYFKNSTNKNRQTFYMFSALAISATIAIAYSGNLITTLIFYELLTITTFPLVTMHQSYKDYKSGKTYLTYFMGASVALFLPAILLTIYIAGTSEFKLGGILPEDYSPTILSIIYLMFGFGIAKAAIMPLHKWLPKAMVAPTPVSSIVHAVAVVKSGVFILAKITLYVFGAQLVQNLVGAHILLLFAIISILLASIFAFREKSIKGMLAYSTICQLGYITIGIILATPLSILGSLTHMIAHSLAKSTLFFGAGSIYQTSGKKQISEIKGIGSKMPLTIILFSFASLTLMGMPLTIGMISKFFLFQGIITSTYPMAIIILIFSTLMNAAYLLPIIYDSFFVKPEQQLLKKISQLNNNENQIIILAMIIATTSIAALFLFHEPIIEILSQELFHTT